MAYDARTKRRELFALFDIKGQKEAVWDWAGPHLPTAPDEANRQSVSGTRCIYHIGPSHWILRDNLDQEEKLQVGLRPDASPADISIVRVSDTMTFFSVVGPDAGQIMAIASPLDLHADVFPLDAVTFSEVFGLKALILRHPGGFEFSVEQSFGNMVEDYLARAIG